MIYKAFDKQIEFHTSNARIRGLFAGKRGGKTEAGAVEAKLHCHYQPGYDHSEIDPYLGLIVAPTTDMLKNLSMKKFLAYTKDMNPYYNKTDKRFILDNNSEVIGASADKPERIEGHKASWVWFDEIFQMKEQVFLEGLARVADTAGRIWVTGSLGVQYRNPKAHWVYRHFIEKPLEGSQCFQWTTFDNPHVPREEIYRLKDTLDPRAYKAMFTINWDVQAQSAVYEDFDESNIIRNYTYNPRLETSISIDWGWTHPMAATFYQYDLKTKSVYLFDEIIKSKMTRDELWAAIQAKGYKIKNWYCDAAGTQTREDSGRSNVNWFSDSPRNIHFKYRRSRIISGIICVRSYVKNALGQRRFFIDELKCPKSVDGMKNYSYPEKDGKVTGELPIKDDDDAVDSIRYYFINRHESEREESQFKELNRFGKSFSI